MKKIFSISILLVSTFIIFLSSCTKDTAATVKITVKESGVEQAGITVYMFDSNQAPNTGFFEPFFSDKSVVTNSKGVATFNLQDAIDLEIIVSQTTLYFGVFDDDNSELGRTSLTIVKGETKSATINY